MIEADLEEASPDLIAQAKSGNKGAFEDIYRIHVGRVYGVCLRILGDHFRARKLLREALKRP